MKAFALGADGQRAVAVVVPASVERPHLIGSATDGFRARVRNGADSTWMSERDLEAAYRDRLNERRNAADALNRLYEDAGAWAAPNERAWGIAVAMPRTPLGRQGKLARSTVADIFYDGTGIGHRMAPDHLHPLDSVDCNNPGPGLRSWVARDVGGRDDPWRVANASVGFTGAVAVAAALGGHRYTMHDH